jgi:hypothetical protein
VVLDRLQVSGESTLGNGFSQKNGDDSCRDSVSRQ